MGKSRLAEELAKRISAEPHTRLRYFCSSHHQDSALYPVMAQMGRAAGFAQGDRSDARLAKLQVMLAATEPSGEDVALLADLHGLTVADPAPPLDLTPQRRKEKTFEALLRHMECMARHQPVLILFDDIHWIDPSSREWLDRLIERVMNWPVLLLALFRPEFQPPWVGRPQVTLLTLAGLDQRDTAAMVASVAASRSGDVPLPPEMVAEIAERTDGVPLFVEELTKAVLEADAQAPATLSATPHPALPGPATLHASLMARLDRLGSTAREVAQAGAVIGREFGHTMLASITELPEQRLREALDRLTSAGLVFTRGTPPEAGYLFKHALVQDAAYGSLLRGRRQRLHGRIVAIMEERFPELVEAQPAMLARHSIAANLAEQAVAYCLKAAQQAIARAALAEVVTQVRKGLEILTALPDSPWRRRQELDLQLNLGLALTIMKGFSATEVAETLARAHALAEGLERPEHVVPLMVGQWNVYLGRAEHRQAISLGEQIESIGKVRNDVAMQILGRVAQGISRISLGELVAARALLEVDFDLAPPPIAPRSAPSRL